MSRPPPIKQTHTSSLIPQPAEPADLRSPNRAQVQTKLNIIHFVALRFGSSVFVTLNLNSPNLHIFSKLFCFKLNLFGAEKFNLKTKLSADLVTLLLHWNLLWRFFTCTVFLSISLYVAFTAPRRIWPCACSRGNYTVSSNQQTQLHIFDLNKRIFLWVNKVFKRLCHLKYLILLWETLFCSFVFLLYWTWFRFFTLDWQYLIFFFCKHFELDLIFCSVLMLLSFNFFIPQKTTSSITNAQWLSSLFSCTSHCTSVKYRYKYLWR